MAYGHVGNAAAMFPLQRLGAEVWAVHTVQFSNHPGYGGFGGAALPASLVKSVMEGIAARGVLGSCDAVLSGYLGEPETGEAVLDAVTRVRQANPAALWCCDPVIGDAGRAYVRPEIAALLRHRAVPEADILTPNRFELESLTGLPCRTRDEAKRAAASLRGLMRPEGRRCVLVTSLEGAETPPDSLDMLAVAAEGCFLLRTPRLQAAFNGTGDAIAALFLFHLLRTGDPARALAEAGSALHGVLRHTVATGAREIALVDAQNELVAPSLRFHAASC